MSSSRNERDASECVVGGQQKQPLSNGSAQQQQQQQQQQRQQGNNVGILSIATYFPKTYVSQEDLEKFDQVDAGKYTKGLMQEKMGFCTDLEDINSVCLTVTQRLIERSGVCLKDIGFLGVGTETILDKSKSVKSVLMELFEASGNSDIEGVDSTNACYGGTAVLMQAIDRCNSIFWDGRLAIVVAADIAVYARGPARPTGGCGAIAMLIGPNAPLVFDPIRASFFKHEYDFYKPNPASEYPTVDGKLSLKAYITAIDKCYAAYREKYQTLNNLDKVKDDVALLDEFDGILMHSPYCKLVRKSFARLLFNEFNVIAAASAKSGQEEKLKELERYKDFLEIPAEEMSAVYDQWMKLEKVSIKLSEELYQQKTAESLFLSNQVGNMYTASLYSCLVAYLTSKPISELINKPILFFSYGSGMAASMFSARISQDEQAIKKLLVGIQDVRTKLTERLKISPEEFTAHLEHKEKTFALPNRSPTGQPIEASSSAQVGQVTVDSYLFPGTYYLTSVDGMFRRKYSRFESAIIENNNNEANCVPATKSNRVEDVIEREAPTQAI